eukprot:TRINITY_DN7877_c1_g1_i1.p1 TRINITY_DN7877_c1_g1~~TRINITY_DN7877_c1_g1_i1.p1  ORF type:complete len:632 (+),score=126.76 TRINITY_DN7877_c1_g1_i1:171-2066(+)
MQRTKGTLSTVRFFSSLLLTRSTARTRPLHFQVPLSSHPSFFPSVPQNHPHHHSSFNTHQTLYFSSQSDSISELILSNPWSENTENKLQESNPTLTHESVLYVLKKLHKNPGKAAGFFKWVSNKEESKLGTVAYGLILRVLCHKEWMSEFWVVLGEMGKKGIELDEETYKTILGCFSREKMVKEAASLTEFFNNMVQRSALDARVGAVVKIILGSDWSEEVEKKLGDLKISFSDVGVVKILREVRGYPLRALKFFKWVEEKSGFSHNAVTYNAMIRILGRDDCVEDFWNMIKEMKGKGHEMDIDTYIKLLRQFLKRKMMKEAVELYEFMMEGPYKPSIQDCIVLLRQISLSGNPDLDLVFRVVRNYEASGYSLSKGVYDGIHRSLTSVGKFHEADKILKTMKDAGFEPDNITYSQVVFGLCKAGRLDEACEILDGMEAGGCTPDLKTWTILIQGHCLAGEVDKALSCFTNMMEKNCDPDADLLEVLVTGLCSKNRAGAAYTLVVEMVEKARLRPWQSTYKNLIQKLLGEGKLEEALKLLNIMKSHNFPPFPDPFVHYISKFGTVEDAKEFFKALTVKKFPSSTAYLHVFQSFLKEGRHSEAQDLLYKCPHHIRNHVDIVKLFSSTEVGSAA